MFTANSMNCLCEALGVALPGNGTILAISPERHALATRAAVQLMELIKDGRSFLDPVFVRSVTRIRRGARYAYCSVILLRKEQ